MTNKQKYKRLSWFLLAGTMILFAGGLTIPSVSYYAKNHEWFLSIYFFSVGAMGIAAFWATGKYEDERRAETKQKSEEDIKKATETFKEFTDEEIIVCGANLKKLKSWQVDLWYIEVATRWLDLKKKEKDKNSVDNPPV